MELIRSRWKRKFEVPVLLNFRVEFETKVDSAVGLSGTRMVRGGPKNGTISAL